MAKIDRQQTRLGNLLTKQGLLPQRELYAALNKQQRRGESLGAILGSRSVLSRKDLAKTPARQRLLRLIPLLSSLLLAPMAAWSDAGYDQDNVFDPPNYNTPSTDRPPVYEGEPISVPVKALVARWAFGVNDSNYATKKFHYDIDTLGHGMAVRVQLRF